MKLKFAVVLYMKRDENHQWLVFCPGLVGLHTWGDTLKEAISNGKDSVTA